MRHGSLPLIIAGLTLSLPAAWLWGVQAPAAPAGSTPSAPAAGSGVAQAAPSTPGRPPAADTASASWELDLQVSPLRFTTLELSPGNVRSFYYLTYTVTNNTRRDIRLFLPSWELVTGSGEMLRAGRDVPIEANSRIMQSLRSPLLQDHISAIGPLLQGAENSKQVLVVWPAPSARPVDVTIFAAGFSGDSATVTPPKPITKPDGSAASTQVVLRKTRMLRYAAPGDLAARGDLPLPMIEASWVMR